MTLFEHSGYTEALTKGFLSLHADEKASDVASNWCAQVQTNTIAPASTVGAYTTKLDVVHSGVSLPTSYPSLTGNTVTLGTTLTSYE